jgi:hypothetical protein
MKCQLITGEDEQCPGEVEFLWRLPRMRLLPAALSHGIGSDSQRPFAIVIVGDLISDLLTRTGASSRCRPWRMRLRQLARASIPSKHKPVASWDCPSAPSCRSQKQSSGPNAVCSSWFLLAVPRRGNSNRMRMNAVWQRLDAMGCWFGRVSQAYNTSGSHAQFTGHTS